MWAFNLVQIPLSGILAIFIETLETVYSLPFTIQHKENILNIKTLCTKIHWNIYCSSKLEAT